MEYKEVITHGTKFRVQIFQNTVELARALECHEYKAGWEGDSLSNTDRWALGHFKNGKEALDKFKNGYNEPVNDIRLSVDNAIRTLPQEKTVMTSSGVVGYAPIVPNAILGLPNSMISQRRKVIKSKVIDVLYSASVHNGYDSDDIAKAGKKLLETIVKLEKKGYRVRLNIANMFYDDGDADFMIVCIKSENEPMTISRLTFPLATPSMQRIISFAWYERMPQTKYKGGYGCPWKRYFPEKDRKEMCKEFLNRPNSNAVYLECNDIIDKGQAYIDKCFEIDKL